MSETRRTPVFTRYELLEKLGSGGMGAVYKARQKYVNRLVAFKVLPPALRNDAEALQRFEREAGALGRLDHPNVVRVSDAGVEGGFPYLAMELVEGKDLRKILQKQHRLSVDEVIKLGAEMAEALDHIYQQGIVHRDVKPSNIIIRPDGQAVLTDFGEAIGATLPRLTQRGVLIGTFEYMSPEQVAGKELDGLSDLYSLGVVLYECLTGEVPFPRAGESPTEMFAMLKRIQEDPVPSIYRPDAPPHLLEAIHRCLAKEPENRYANGVALANALKTPPDSQKYGSPLRESTPLQKPSASEANDEDSKHANFSTDQDQLSDKDGSKLERKMLPETNEKVAIDERKPASVAAERPSKALVSSENSDDYEIEKTSANRLNTKPDVAPNRKWLRKSIVIFLVVGFITLTYSYFSPPFALQIALLNPTNVTSLNLRLENLKNVPESISRLTNLETLDLSLNQLTTIPESITQLTNLETLNLSSNLLTTIPESISQLTNLKVLYLSSNQLKTLPESITRLTNLETLLLQYNQLETLPESISQLTNLKVLWLFENPIPTAERGRIRRLLPNTKILMIWYTY